MLEAPVYLSHCITSESYRNGGCIFETPKLIIMTHRQLVRFSLEEVAKMITKKGLNSINNLLLSENI